MKKDRTIVFFLILLMISIALRGEQRVLAAKKPAVRSARSGDVNQFDENGDIDVSGEIKNSAKVLEPDIEGPAPSTTRIGGQVTDNTGKNVRTGDVLAPARVLSVLALGSGVLILALGKREKKNQ